jgi:hypothetical protein
MWHEVSESRLRVQGDWSVAGIGSVSSVKSPVPARDERRRVAVNAPFRPPWPLRFSAARKAPESRPELGREVE